MEVRKKHWTTTVGQAAGHPAAFAIVLLYAVLWLTFDAATFDWNAVATLAVWVMTLFIQRSNRRDTLALHAKLDELLRVDSDARSELTRLDEQEPEDIEEHRDTEVQKTETARKVPKSHACEAAQLHLTRRSIGRDSIFLSLVGREIMPRRLIALAFLLACANTAIAADDMKMPINSGDLKWGPAPPVLPKGAEITVLSGDPSKDGPYVLRLKMPSGYKVPAHNHPTTENVTVISGNFHIGMGDKFDEKKGIELTAGGYGEAPAKMNHYAWASTPSVVQVHGQGPFAITYVNPTDDPSKQ